MTKEILVSGSSTSTTIKKGIVNYPKAFDLQRDDLNEYSVYIIPPFKNCDEHIAVFPSSTSKPLGILPIAKEEFSRACSQGDKILDELIKNGLLEEVSLTEVQLKKAFDFSNEERTLKSTGFDLYKIPDFWRIRSILQVSCNTTENYKHGNYLYYGKKWHKPQDMSFILKEWAKNEAIADSKFFVYICKKYLKAKTYFQVPYSYFFFNSKQQIDFKQKGTQPIKKLLKKYRFNITDWTGKGSPRDREMRGRRRELIIRIFKNENQKKEQPVSQIIRNIRKEWEKELIKEYPDEGIIKKEHFEGAGVDFNKILDVLIDRGFVYPHVDDKGEKPYVHFSFKEVDTGFKESFPNYAEEQFKMINTILKHELEYSKANSYRISDSRIRRILKDERLV